MRWHSVVVELIEFQWCEQSRTGQHGCSGLVLPGVAGGKRVQQPDNGNPGRSRVRNACARRVNAYRTLSRIAFQFINMLSRVLWPVFSRQYGDKADETMHEPYCCGAVASSDVATVLSFVGPSLIQWRTYGAIAYIPGFFNLVMVVAALSRSYQVGLILFATVNKLAGLSMVYISASLSSIGAAFLARKQHFGDRRCNRRHGSHGGCVGPHVQLLRQGIFR
ncbi:hypothetical protein M0D69_36140 [Caballeronia sp. SEWSISQ10-4 2]|uniref:hypothetical protein n=1 Tax=Caballeronia sp. SEWSISQ10-4 2 TaxID=2937438 RepID=UPI00264F1945|nr:hypothetical protein [Caballeronia sp. SEWSISQ10-4 2]MDN7183351.1 hypothetical protein [Caballeronia sp. SEWSISQ10-4 2]